MATIFNANGDAWCTSQMESKLWLCGQLERLIISHPMEQINNVIWIMAGWYALTAQLLLVRNHHSGLKIRSFDIDPQCEIVADTINELWVFNKWQFKAFTEDCNLLDYEHPERYSSAPPTVVINTACEHFEHDQWWDRIPAGMLVALQSNNQQHDDHIGCFDSLETFDAAYPMTETIYKGCMAFDYTEWNFKRWMKIGRK